VNARPVDLAGEVGGNPAVQGQEAEESPQRANIALEALPTQAWADWGDERLDLGGLEILQRDVLLVHVLKKTLRCVSVM